jgi:hypothetical protein
MRSGESEVPEQRVRRVLAQLGADADSAPDVPPAVMARIGAALRAAPPPPAHASFSGRPRMSRLRVIWLVIGLGAVAALLALGIAVSLHTSPAPRFPSGPTADKMTVSQTPADTPPPVVTRP